VIQGRSSKADFMDDVGKDDVVHEICLGLGYHERKFDAVWVGNSYTKPAHCKSLDANH
jgi:hypothetical protein